MPFPRCRDPSTQLTLRRAFERQSLSVAAAAPASDTSTSDHSSSTSEDPLQKQSTGAGESSPVFDEKQAAKTKSALLAAVLTAGFEASPALSGSLQHFSNAKLSSSGQWECVDSGAAIKAASWPLDAETLRQALLDEATVDHQIMKWMRYVIGTKGTTSTSTSYGSSVVCVVCQRDTQGWCTAVVAQSAFSAAP